jgi:hypothetical protein
MVTSVWYASNATSGIKVFSVYMNVMGRAKLRVFPFIYFPVLADLQGFGNEPGISSSSAFFPG